MTAEYKEHFEIRTHIQTGGRPVAKSALVTLEKVGHDTVMISLGGSGDFGSRVFVGMNPDGFPFVTIADARSDCDFKFRLEDERWVKQGSGNEFSASDVMRLRDWLGVKGGDLTEEAWQGMDDRTRRLYVRDLVGIVSGGE